MTWLLKLYPPGWRRRYGHELVELVGAQRFSIGLVVDVIAGAIDAWIHPQMSAVVPAQSGGDTMLAKMMRFRCAGYGPHVTPSDQWKSVGVVLGLTVVLTLGWMWLHVRIGDNPYTDALSMMPVMTALLVSMRYTYLKGRSAATQAIFIAGNLALLTVFFLAMGWIGARL